MAYAFYVGIDVTDDRKGVISLVEKASTGEDENVKYRIHRIDSIEDNQNDEQIAARVRDMIAESPYTGRTSVVVNKTTDPGQMVVNRLIQTGLTPIGVIISGGDSAAQTGTGMARTSAGVITHDTSGFMVSEHVLVDCIERLYQEGRTELPREDSDSASLLSQGLQSYRARAHEAGEALEHISEEPRRDADHSEYVISAALACWYGEQQHSFDPAGSLEEFQPTTGEAKRKIRPDSAI